MSKKNLNNGAEYDHDTIRVVLIFPDESPEDEYIKKEIREILVTALREQLTS